MFHAVVVVGLTLLSVAYCQTSSAGTIAFSATYFSNERLTPNTVLVYDLVLSNQGRAYNSTSGVFTAPREGFYSFYFNLLIDGGHDAWLNLYKNSISMVAIFSRGTDDNDSAGTSNFVILKLNRRDVVYVKVGRQDIQFGYFEEVQSTFTGFSLP